MLSSTYGMLRMNFCHHLECDPWGSPLSLWQTWNLRRKKVLGFAKSDEHKESPAGREKAQRGKRRSQIARISDCCIQQGPLTTSIVIDSARRQQKRLCRLYLLTFGTREQQQSPAADSKSMWHFHPSSFLFRRQKKKKLESPDREGGGGRRKDTNKWQSIQTHARRE